MAGEQVINSKVRVFCVYGFCEEKKHFPGFLFFCFLSLLSQALYLLSLL